MCKKSMCVKEKVTTNDKLERVCVFFVSYANISHMHLRDRKARRGDSVWLCATERERPLAHGQERSDKQGREVKRDVWRKCRHGEERVYVCDIEIPWRL